MASIPPCASRTWSAAAT